jgi:diamine N-acetyltransferase
VIYDDSDSYGFIDLFDYDHISRRAGIGIVIFERFRSKGFGSLSLKLIEEHVLNHVPIHQLYANISSDNFESISLFKKNGYCRVGIKKDWVFYKNKFNDVILFQKILNK